MAHEQPRLRFTDEELTPDLKRYAKRAEKAADKAEKAQAKLAKGKKKGKLRDIGQVFNFGIGWDNASKTITIDTSTGYTA